jgi:thioredoxin-related protein
MKSLLFVLACTLFIQPSDWLTDFDKAKATAQQNDKMLLLNFSGSDWCAPCIKMKKEVFEKEVFQDYAAQHLVLVRADFPRQKKNQLTADQKTHNEKLADQYNQSGAFPLTLLLDAHGKVIHTWNGFKDTSAEEFVKQLDAKIHGK